MEDTKLFGFASQEELASRFVNMLPFHSPHYKLFNHPHIILENASAQIYAHRIRVIIARYSAIEHKFENANSDQQTQRQKYNRGAFMKSKPCESKSQQLSYHLLKE